MGATCTKPTDLHEAGNHRQPLMPAQTYAADIGLRCRCLYDVCAARSEFREL
jgi:hypothetical protein